MKHQFVGKVFVLLGLIQAVPAEAVVRQAVIQGSRWGGSDSCTIEIDVDGSAEVEISGDSGDLRTVSGAEAVWRRFRCSAPLPFNAPDLRMARSIGRGTVRLIRNPRNSRGGVLVRIDDPQKGRGIYAFDLEWRGAGGGGWHAGPAPGPGFGWANRACQDAVTSRVNQIGYPITSLDQSRTDQNGSGAVRISGTVTGRQRFESRLFSYSCTVDLRSGRLQSVDVRRR